MKRYTGIRIEREHGELWLVWQVSAMGGVVWEWKQRRLWPLVRRG